MGGTTTAFAPIVYLADKQYELEGRESPKMSYRYFTRPAAEIEK